MTQPTEEEEEVACLLQHISMTYAGRVASDIPLVISHVQTTKEMAGSKSIFQEIIFERK